jgi:hypothetical protein
VVHVLIMEKVLHNFLPVFPLTAALKIFLLLQIAHCRAGDGCLISSQVCVIQQTPFMFISFEVLAFPLLHQ